MDYLIWYNASTKSCYLGLKGQYTALLEKYSDNVLMLVEERKIRSEVDYRKTLRMMVKIRNNFRSL